MSPFSKHSQKSRGFTIVELMVTISIMIVILGTLVGSQSSYSDGAALQNLADTIGLTLRQAQVYGISVKELGTGSNNFSAAYGADFDVTSTSNKSSYIFFADLPPYNGIYDSGQSCPVGGSSECITKSAIAEGDTIQSLCEIPLTGANNCSIGRIDVTFLRPEINAQMVFFGTDGSQLSLTGVKGAEINLVSPSGLTSSVTVYTTGQISVK